MPARLEIVSSAPQEAEALCTVQEGKFHQVKRMFSSRGVHVVYLKRLSIGPVPLDPPSRRRLSRIDGRGA